MIVYVKHILQIIFFKQLGKWRLTIEFQDKRNWKLKRVLALLGFETKPKYQNPNQHVSQL